MTSRVIFDPKTSGSTVMVTFSFAAQLPSGTELVADESTVTAAVYSGEDTAPEDILSGDPEVHETTVTQFITAGEEGVIYDLLCSAEADDGQVLTQSAYLAIVPTVP